MRRLGTLLFVGMVGCGGGGGSERVDAGGAVDAGARDASVVDAAVEADGGSDAGPTDAGEADAATDGGTDGGVDAGPGDAGTDAGPPDAGLRDAGPLDAGPDGGLLLPRCGGGAGDHLLFSGRQPGLPRIAWDGARYAYALFSRTGPTAAEPMEGFVGFASAAGTASPPAQVTPDDGEASIWPRVVAAERAGERRYGVVYLDDRGERRAAYFALLDETGAPIREELLSSGDGERADDHALAYAPSAGLFAAAWSGSEGVHVARIATDGAVLGSTLVAPSTAALAYTGTPMVWAGDRFALVMGPAGEIVEVFPDGSLGDRHPLGVSGIRFALGWSGSEYAVAWQQGGVVRFLRADGDGVIADSERELDPGPDGGEADVAWGGTEWGVVWHRGSSTMPSDVWFATVSAAGVAGAPRRLTTTGEVDWWPSLTWCGQFAVVYEHGRTGVGETGELRLVFP